MERTVWGSAAAKSSDQTVVMPVSWSARSGSFRAAAVGLAALISPANRWMVMDGFPSDATARGA